MSRVIIAIFITSLVSLGGAAGWYFNQESGYKSAYSKLVRVKQNTQGVLKFNNVSNVERIKDILVYLAEIDIADIWITDIEYDNGRVAINYRARNSEAVTEYLQAFYDSIDKIPYMVDEVSANEKGKKSTKVAKQQVRKVPFVIAYIQKKLQNTRKSLSKSDVQETKVEQDYNYELSVKLEEE